jgi:hypothetical protein
MTLILSVKQGEELSIPFTVKADGLALDLTDYTISVEAKVAPNASTQPMFSKTITSTSDEDTVGIINSPTTGEWILRLTANDTKYQQRDYTLVIKLIGNGDVDIISGENCDSAIYRICKQ